MTTGHIWEVRVTEWNGSITVEPKKNGWSPFPQGWKARARHPKTEKGLAKAMKAAQEWCDKQNKKERRAKDIILNSPHVRTEDGQAIL